MPAQSTLPNEQLPRAQQILGIDTSLRSSGMAVVCARGKTLETLEYRVVKNPPTRRLSESLAHLGRETAAIIQRWQLDAVAVEGIFYCKNVKTTLALGQARGVVLAACAGAQLPIFEYPPRRIKQAVAGFGNAGKEQVRRMVMAILHLHEAPHEDAADALAIAVCHLYGMTRWKRAAGLAAQEI